MSAVLEKINFIDVTVENVGVCCIKNKKSPGYAKKVAWFKDKINAGLKIKIVADEDGKQHGFIEYLPSELAWRPIKAKGYYFIQCIALFGKELRNHTIGSTLLKECERDAIENGKVGVCTMTSNGPWIATKEIFSKNGFKLAEEKGRFELMYKPLGNHNSIPQFNDWTKCQERYKGWNIIYSDQCPWHEKSVVDLQKAASKHGIKLNVERITTPKEAQNAPSGFGTFSLVKDGELLEDHYISKTRFENILKKYMNC